MFLGHCDKQPSAVDIGAGGILSSEGGPRKYSSDPKYAILKDQKCGTSNTDQVFTRIVKGVLQLKQEPMNLVVRYDKEYVAL